MRTRRYSSIRATTAEERRGVPNGLGQELQSAPCEPKRDRNVPARDHAPDSRGIVSSLGRQVDSVHSAPRVSGQGQRGRLE